MLREQINERRASKGLNALPTGGTGKGDRPRANNKPDWHYYEVHKEQNGFVWLKIKDGHYKIIDKDKYKKHMDNYS